jgi:hypothetical protein
VVILAKLFLAAVMLSAMLLGMLTLLLRRKQIRKV